MRDLCVDVLLQFSHACSLVDDDVAVLCQHATQLTTLKLGGRESKLTDACLPAIQALAARHTLTDLSLDLLTLSSDGAAVLASMLADRKCSLQHLDILLENEEELKSAL